MKNALHFDPQTQQLVGPAGSLPIAATDQVARHVFMLMEGQCQDANVADVARRYGYSRQRYYQILAAFTKGGTAALQPGKTGPKTNYRRTDEVVRQVLRHRFLDPDASAEVILQKLRQAKYSISLRSVERILADFGVQKKTLLAQPQKPGAVGGRRRQPADRGPKRSGRSTQH